MKNAKKNVFSLFKLKRIERNALFTFYDKEKNLGF